MKNNPIPSGYPSWNSFMSLRLKSQEDCKSILSDLEEKTKEGGAVSDEENKVALFYKAAMDEDAIEAAGVDPMKPLLELCAEAANCKDNKEAFAKCLGEMALKYSVHPFFTIGGEFRSFHSHVTHTRDTSAINTYISLILNFLFIFLLQPALTRKTVIIPSPKFRREASVYPIEITTLMRIRRSNV